MPKKAVAKKPAKKVVKKGGCGCGPKCVCGIR